MEHLNVVMKRIKVAYYGLIVDIPEEGIEIQGESMVMPFSVGEPPYCRKNADESIDYLDWVAIFDIVEEKGPKVRKKAEGVLVDSP
jgi:hypothetical protein